MHNKQATVLKGRAIRVEMAVDFFNVDDYSLPCSQGEIRWHNT